MIELLCAVLIIGALIAGALFTISSYTAWARQTSDKQTLTVLNDALTRYKCEGGDLTALTSGANVGRVLAKLATPISWSGYQHQVMAKGVTYPSRSLQGAGFRQSYRFTRYNSFGNPPFLVRLATRCHDESVGLKCPRRHWQQQFPGADKPDGPNRV
jgi:type II secretory pathway pseudopilin PulG